MRIPWPRPKPVTEPDHPTEGEQAHAEAKKALQDARAQRPDVEAVGALLHRNRDAFTDALAASMRRHR